MKQIHFTGSNPSVNQQLDNPRLINCYVSSDTFIHRLPVYKKDFDLINVKAIHISTISGTFIATKNELFSYSGTQLTLISAISGSDSPYRFAENQQNEIILTTGIAAYVYKTSDSTFHTLGAGNGFDIKNPIDALVLNTFTIIIGGTDRKWTVSNPNDALTYNNNDVQLSDSSMGNLTALGTFNNNVFIFAENGVERWVPGVETFQASFPFYRDSSFREDFGAISTSSVLSFNNAIFYLSNDGHIRSISKKGQVTITSPGIAVLISKYTDLKTGFGTYYSHKGSYFYQVSFLEISWVYNIDSNNWAESETFLIDYAGTALSTDSVGTIGSFYELSPAKVVMQSNYVTNVLLDAYTDIEIKSIILSITAGNVVVSDLAQKAELQLSKDNVSFGTTISIPIPIEGERLKQLRWFEHHIASSGFSFRFTIWAKYDFSVRGACIN